LAETIDVVDLGGRKADIPVVSGVRAGVRPNNLTVPAPVLRNTLVVLVVDDYNLGGDFMVVADITMLSMAAEIAAEGFTTRNKLVVDTKK